MSVFSRAGWLGAGAVGTWVVSTADQGFVGVFNLLRNIPGPKTESLTGLQLAEILAATRQGYNVTVVSPSGNGSVGTLAKCGVVVVVAYGGMKLRGATLPDIVPASRRSLENATSIINKKISLVSNKIRDLADKLGVLQGTVDNGFSSVQTSIASLDSSVSGLQNDLIQVGQSVQTSITSLDSSVSGLQNDVIQVGQDLATTREGVELLCQVVAETMVNNRAPTNTQRRLLSFAAAANPRSIFCRATAPAVLTIPSEIANVENDSKQTTHFPQLASLASALVSLTSRQGN